MRSITRIRLLAAGIGAACALAAGPAASQANEQFFPVLSYRTGPYGPNGAPYANGYVDYLKLVNARDAGIGGVKVTFEECEFGYDTARGVECYERLKGRGPTGATLFQPLSTGVTFALTDKVALDKIPLITSGYGRSDSVDGTVFKWNFPLGGTYWDAADIILQHLAKKEGGWDRLKGKKIALVYHDSPFGKEPIVLLQERAKMHGFDLSVLPVTHPGVEQKATWLQIRQNRPDYVMLWGWGVMNPTALKEAQATGYPRDRIYGSWWSGSEPDVREIGDTSRGYNALIFQAGAGQGRVHQDILKFVHDKGQGTGKREEVGEVLYNRGMVHAMMAIEAVKRAQTRFGKKPLTGEQVRWGLENFALSDAQIKTLGFEGYMAPISTTCVDHAGSRRARIHSWDGKKWAVSSDWYEADQQIIKPMITQSAKRFADEKKLMVRDCAKEASS